MGRASAVVLFVLGVLWFPNAECVNPLYLTKDIGAASWGGRMAARSLSQPLMKGGNTLFNLAAKNNLAGTVSTTMGRPSLLTRPLLPAIMAMLGPLETAWEFYVKRDEILESLVTQGLVFARRNSVRATGTFLTVFALADVLARTGVIGKRGEGIWRTLRKSETVSDAVEEQFFGKLARDATKFGIDSFRRFRSLGGSSKFAVALSAGAFFSKAAVQAAVATVKAGLATFFILEVMAYSGIIGKPGESIFEWVDHHKDQTAEWMKHTYRFRKAVRNHLSLKYLEEFYETAVEEEQVASMGFTIGSLMGMF